MIDGQGIEMNHGHARKTQYGYYEITEGFLEVRENRARLSSWGSTEIHGYESAELSSSNDVYISGDDVYINNNSISYTSYGPITDFDWDYDYNTGCIDSIYNISRMGVWTS